MTERSAVLLVDDEELVRFGLRTVLEAAGGFEVVGEAGDGADGGARWPASCGRTSC